MRLRLVLAMSALAVSAFSVTANVGLAQTPPAAAPAAPAAAAPAAKGKGGPLEACRDDVDKLCASAEKTQGWRAKCLRENAAQLSSACKSAVAALREVREKVRAACKDDLATLCKTEDAAKEGARPMQCLRQNDAKLSAGCKSAMTAAFSAGEGDGEAPAAPVTAPPASGSAPAAK